MSITMKIGLWSTLTALFAGAACVLIVMAAERNDVELLVWSVTPLTLMGVCSFNIGALLYQRDAEKESEG